MNARAVGGKYEALAMAYAAQTGAEHMESNFRCRRGEIDLIFRDGGYLVFAEVKYRSGGRYGQAAEAVGIRKQQVISRVSDLYRLQNHIPEDCPVRFDVFAVDAPENAPVQIRWIKDAFPYRTQRGRAGF